MLEKIQYGIEVIPIHFRW